MKNQNIFCSRKGGPSVTDHYTFIGMRKERRSARKLVNETKREEVQETRYTIHPTKGYRKVNVVLHGAIYKGRKKIERFLNRGLS